MQFKIEKKDISPKCPHCERVVHKLIEVKRSIFTTVQVFCCPHCHKIIGTGAQNA